jgi:predicted SprT family Zn-dependent metalloprotease
MTFILRQRGAVTSNFPRKEEFVRAVRACQANARRIFPEFTLTDHQLPIVFFRKGRTAGFAHRQGNIYNVEFNLFNIQNNWDEMVLNTIPHEMAHIVDMFMNGCSNGHNHVWQRIAHRLGCEGDRCHTMQVQRARRTKKYVYITSCGQEWKAGAVRHKNIQRGVVYTLKSTGGKITADGYTGKMVVVS